MTNGRSPDNAPDGGGCIYNERHAHARPRGGAALQIRYGAGVPQRRRGRARRDADSGQYDRRQHHDECASGGGIYNDGSTPTGNATLEVAARRSAENARQSTTATAAVRSAQRRVQGPCDAEGSTRARSATTRARDARRRFPGARAVLFYPRRGGRPDPATARSGDNSTISGDVATQTGGAIFNRIADGGWRRGSRSATRCSVTARRASGTIAGEASAR